MSRGAIRGSYPGGVKRVNVGHVCAGRTAIFQLVKAYHRRGLETIPRVFFEEHSSAVIERFSSSPPDVLALNATGKPCRTRARRETKARFSEGAGSVFDTLKQDLIEEFSPNVRMIPFRALSVNVSEEKCTIRYLPHLYYLIHCFRLSKTLTPTVLNKRPRAMKDVTNSRVTLGRYGLKVAILTIKYGAL